MRIGIYHSDILPVNRIALICDRRIEIAVADHYPAVIDVSDDTVLVIVQMMIAVCGIQQGKRLVGCSHFMPENLTDKPADRSVSRFCSEEHAVSSFLKFACKKMRLCAFPAAVESFKADKRWKNI